MSSPAVVPPLPAGQSRGGPHRIVEEPAASHRTIRVGLLGFGTVGRGLYALLERRRDATARRHGVAFEITVILVRDVERARDAMPASALVTSDPERFLAGRFDVVVEAIGGVEPAARLVGTLLERGVDVVTANKALLADRWDALHALAAASGARLRWEASVAAGIPVVGLLRRSLQSTQVSRVTAILNATSNLVLTKIAWGSSLEDALLHARRQGFAEADPTLDVSGIDAAQKLAILVATIRSRALAPSEIDVQGIESVRPEDSVRAAAFGGHLKPIAFADLGDARPGAWIAPAFVPDRHPLARVEGTSNGVHLTGDTVSDLFLS
ncbi:MAG: homoserine dehydrogenase, partial [Planctomycetes bacterium]|nr:homoserine dehydrogenase [Planctomycetota bacterium]